MSPTLLSALILVAPAALTGSAGAQVWFREDFENGLASWTAEGLWHLENASQPCAAPLVPFPSGVQAAWFGSPATCEYWPSAPQSHWLRQTTPVQLPASNAHLVLRFRRFLESEGCTGGYDLTVLRLSTDGGATWSPYALDCRQNATFVPWMTTRVPIDSLAGQSVLVAFVFRVDPPFDEGRGWWIDDVEFAAEPGTTSCQATLSSCPCNNAWTNIAADENYGGCQNSRHAEAVLYGDGIASVSNDGAVLRVADMLPGAPAILVQSPTTASVPFGDGRRCLGGTPMRLWTHTGTQPIESFPAPGDVGLAVRGGIPPAGGVMHYQVVYRDAATWCTSATWNTSNAYRIEWTP